MRSAVVIHTVHSLANNKGGPSRSVPRICRELLSRGEWDVEIITCDGKNGPSWSTEDPLWEHLRSVRKLRVPIVMRQALSGRGAGSIVHDHGTWLLSNQIAFFSAKALRVPFVVSPRGMLEPWALAYRSTKKRLALRTYEGLRLQHATAFHATSEAEATNLRRLNLRQPIAVIPNGVDAPPVTVSRTRLPIRTALFMSRLSVKKGIFTLLDAWARLQPPGWRLRIVGPADDISAADLRARICALGVDNVAVDPEVDDVEKWKVFEEADLFVFPSFSENFGLVIAEALACGVPVITTTGTPWAGVVRERCGWMIEPDVSALETVLGEALNCPTEQLQDMGSRGRSWVSREYTWEAAGLGMAEFYRWIHSGMHANERPRFVMQDET